MNIELTHSVESGPLPFNSGSYKNQCWSGLVLNTWSSVDIVAGANPTRDHTPRDPSLMRFGFSTSLQEHTHRATLTSRYGRSDHLAGVSELRTPLSRKRGTQLRG